MFVRWMMARGRRLGLAWERLVEPARGIHDPEKRQQAKLLTSILLVLLLTTGALFVVRLPAHGLVLNPETLARLAIVLFVLPASLLSRRGYLWPVSLAAALFGSLLLFILAGLEADPAAPVLNYLIVVMLFGSVFLPARLNLVVFIAQLAGMILFARVRPGMTMAGLLDGPLSLHLTAGVVVLATAWHRDLLEAGRRAELLASERRFRELFEASPLGIELFDAAGQIQTVNQAGLALFGSGAPSAVPVLDPLADPRLPAAAKPKLQAGEIVRYETQWAGPAGEPVYLDVVLTALGAASGRIHGYLAHCLDISARKRAEAALQQAQAILETTPSILYVFDLAARQNVYTNRPFASVLGYSGDPANDIGSVFSPAVTHPDDRPALQDKFQWTAQARDGDIFSCEYRVRHADGTWHWIGAREMVFSRAGNGAPQQIMGVAQDITTRKQAEAALRESEERFRVLVNTLPDGIAVVASDGRLTFVSPNALALFGRDQPAEALGRSPLAFIAPEDQARAQADIQNALRGLPSPHNQYTLLKKDGARFAGEFNSAVLTDAAGQLLGIVVVIRDITERRRADEILRVTLLKYQTLFEAFPLGITISDQAGRILEANSVAETLLGVPRAFQTQRTIDDPAWTIIRPDGTPMPPQEFPSVRVLAEQRPIENVEMGVVKADHSVTWLSVTAAPLPLEERGVVVTFSNITERKRAEAALETVNRELERALEREQQLARTDPLTGVYNRRFLFELAEREFE
ncbi:MAG: PAS domain S-box protein, partial [Anaerolineales bacterium]|nr:PAS domain S-box protein [Anaerolineales bacterium]